LILQFFKDLGSLNNWGFVTWFLMEGVTQDFSIALEHAIWQKNKWIIYLESSLIFLTALKEETLW
jgi:hypothetical protein